MFPEILHVDLRENVTTPYGIVDRRHLQGVKFRLRPDLNGIEVRKEAWQKGQSSIIPMSNVRCFSLVPEQPAEEKPKKK